MVNRLNASPWLTAQPASASRGFSLIEAMVTVAIIGMLAVVAVPYTMAWINDARVQQSIGSLSLAYKKAKAVALRNPLSVTSTTGITASLKNINGLILVCQGDPTDAGCVVNGARVIWQTQLTDGVVVNLNNAAMTNHGLNTAGQNIDGNGAPQTLTYNISKGSVNETGNLR